MGIGSGNKGGGREDREERTGKRRAEGEEDGKGGGEGEEKT